MSFQGISKFGILAAASMVCCTAQAAAYNGPGTVTWLITQDNGSDILRFDYQEGIENIGAIKSGPGSVINETVVRGSNGLIESHAMTWRSQISLDGDGALRHADGISGFYQFAYGNGEDWQDWRIDADGKIFGHLSTYDKQGSWLDLGEHLFAQLGNPQTVNARGDIRYDMTLVGEGSFRFAPYAGHAAGTLTISSVPEPGAFLLAISGVLVAGCVAVARSRMVGSRPA